MEQYRPLSERPLLELLCAASRARATGQVILRDRQGDRHGVCLEEGYVRSVQIAGRYDPLISLLAARGLLDPATRARCLAMLAESPARSGALAGLLGALPPPTLRDVIRAQQLARFAELLRLGEQGHDARLEPSTGSPPEHNAVRLPLGTLLRALGREPPPGTTDELGRGEESDPAAAKRRLRRIARAIHPDRHPQASEEQRRALGQALAEATARYHGFIEVA